MNSLATNTVILPGIVALLLFLVFTYLYEQSRQPYFRAWQLGWASVLPALRAGRLELLRQPSAWVLSGEFASDRRDGAVPFCFDALDARTLPAALV